MSRSTSTVNDTYTAPPGFSFDLSYSYYSPAYERPGPEVRVYRLQDCVQRYGGRA